MKIGIKIHRDKVSEEFYLRAYLLIKENKRRWQSSVAVLALGSGFLSPFIGVFLDLVDWLTATSIHHSFLYKTSLAFYALTLPLLALGSHCLDLLEKKSALSPSDDLAFHRFNAALKT